MKIAVATFLACLLMACVSGIDQECVNRLRLDVYCLNDASNSINSVGWGRSLDFVQKISELFPFGLNTVRFAFGIFSSKFEHRIYLNQYDNQPEFAEDVNSTVQLKANTHTYDALDAINKNDYLFDPSHGGERDVPKIVILTTDGQSQNVSRTIAAAKRLRIRGIIIFAVGVGVISKNELVGVAGDERYVFTVKNFAGLESIIQNMTERFCEAATTTATPEPTTTTPEPTTTTPEPTTTTPEPTTTTTTTTTPEPTTTTPEPTTTTPEPTTTTSTTTTPEPTTTTPPPNPCPPEIIIDVCLAIDSSGSIGAKNYKENFVFIRQFIASFTVGENAAKFALAIYGTGVYVIFKLTADNGVIDQKLQNVSYRNSTTRTDLCLNKCGELLQPENGGRPNAAQIIVLVTDGKSTKPDLTQVAANQVKGKGIEIICLGVGKDCDQKELNAIASRPEYNIPIANYGVLSKFAALISNLTCHTKS